VCGTCEESKALTEFNRRTGSRDGLQSVCRDCNRASARAYYAANRRKHIDLISARKKAQIRALHEIIAEYLSDHPCVDCGNPDLRVLDFDHRPGVRKRDGVMRLVALGFGATIVLAEIDKCDVRCRNCHAIVTYERMGDNWRTSAMSGASSAEDGTREGCAPDAGRE
jgi:hypothetical protein